MPVAEDVLSTAADLHINQGMSVLRVATIVGIDSAVLRVALRERGIVPRIPAEFHTVPVDVPDAPPLFPGEILPSGRRRWLRDDGYVGTLMKGRHRREHRWIMEEHLGRTLGRDEHVHHRNGVKHDNRLKNLVVLDKWKHHLIENTLQGRWARHHDCCVRCGTTARLHHAKGYCTECYERVVRGHAPRGSRRGAPQWSRLWAACVSCGSTERPHHVRGLCSRCREQTRSRFPSLTDIIHQRGRLTTEDVAAMHHVTTERVKGATQRGVLIPERIRSRVAFTREQAEAWRPRRPRACKPSHSETS